jgi:peptidoglycan/LPS O-acetylase OafA/YrhL
VVVITSLFAGWFLLLPQAFKELGESAVSQSALVSNVYFWVKSWINAGYFAPASEVKPLLHTWSLAVEEQFYLLFPFLLLALRRRRRASLILVIAGMAAASFVLCLYSSYHHPSAGFYLLPFRAWELLLGSLLAAAPLHRFNQQLPREVLSWCGLVAILCAIFLFDKTTRFPGVAAALPCIGTAIIIGTNGQGVTAVGRLLGMRPMVFIGLISYSLYLWHWPVFVFFKYQTFEFWTTGEIPLIQRISLLVFSFIMAVITWKFIESPFRKRVLFQSRPAIFTFATLITTCLIFTGALIYLLKGIPSRIGPELLRYSQTREADAMPFKNDMTLQDTIAGNFGELGNNDKLKPISILVWGDSHAMAALPLLDLLCREHSLRGVAATHSATPPLLDYQSPSSSLKADSVAFAQTVVGFVRSQHIKEVILIAKWGFYPIESDVTRIRTALMGTIRQLTKAGARVTIMKQVPQHPYDVAHILTPTIFLGYPPAEVFLTVLALPIPVIIKNNQRKLLHLVQNSLNQIRASAN